MDFRAYIRRLGAGRRILKNGPCYNPIFPKGSGVDIWVMYHAPKEDLDFKVLASATEKQPARIVEKVVWIRQTRSADPRGLSAVGFTTFDAAAGVWTASESDQFTAAARTALQAPDTCGAMRLWTDMTQ